MQLQLNFLISFSLFPKDSSIKFSFIFWITIWYFSSFLQKVCWNFCIIAFEFVCCMRRVVIINDWSLIQPAWCSNWSKFGLLYKYLKFCFKTNIKLFKTTLWTFLYTIPNGLGQHSLIGMNDYNLWKVIWQMLKIIKFVIFSILLVL